MEDKSEDFHEIQKARNTHVSFLRCVLSKVFTPKSLRLVKGLLVRAKTYLASPVLRLGEGTFYYF